MLSAIHAIQYVKIVIRARIAVQMALQSKTTVLLAITVMIPLFRNHVLKDIISVFLGKVLTENFRNQKLSKQIIILS